MPTCHWLEVRRVILNQLGNRYGRRFDTHWDFVRYAQEQGLDLDFTTPPKRPTGNCRRCSRSDLVPRPGIMPCLLTTRLVQHHDPFDAVIADYLQQVEAGAVPNRDALLARHPDLADRLRAFFADFDRVDRQAGGLRLSHNPDSTVGGGAQTRELPRVRYFGDYELLEEIARGGMGVVYRRGRSASTAWSRSR